MYRKNTGPHAKKDRPKLIFLSGSGVPRNKISIKSRRPRSDWSSALNTKRPQKRSTVVSFIVGIGKATFFDGDVRRFLHDLIFGIFLQTAFYGRYFRPNSRSDKPESIRRFKNCVEGLNVLNGRFKGDYFEKSIASTSRENNTNILWVLFSDYIAPNNWI